MALVATAFKDEADVEQVGDGVGEEEGDAVVDGGVVTAKGVAEFTAVGWKEGVAEGINRDEVDESGASTAANVFRELENEWRVEHAVSLFKVEVG